ncbi:flagellar basal body-associated FliL family protein [Ramlibacter humi]|uniref:Flagellar protein FliL n=1 Tax=Ramlibacter humi TaxID=2530451 RepID=A0A4Z0CD29_9BURK|nr:flagellar basal body-associated FliL family protein [Ramlibacter humi]TFZ08340.1 flagellar basal body-associated protein FliL [Ramlibacter humi]
MSEAAAEPKKKSGKKMIVIAIVALLAAGGGGGGAWFFLGHKAEAGEEHAEKPKKASKPLFTTLEPFTVNLQDPRGERFAQIGITLQFEDPKLEAELKDRLPAVRNEILLLISSKQIEELLSTEGKQKLAEEIRLRSARAIGIDVAEVAAHGSDDEDEDEDDAKAKAKAKKKGKHKAPERVENPIQGVLFSQFIVQ